MDTSTPPPIAPSDLPGPKRSWNRTVGVIALIFGILGFLGALIAPVSLRFTKIMMKTFEEQGADSADVADYIEKLSSLSMMSTIALAILGIMLAVGGIFLMKTKRLGSPLLKIWAVLKIVFGIFVNYKNYGLTQQQMEIQTSVGGMDPTAAEMTESITNIAVLVGMIFGTLWVIALPVFLLIWLNRSKIKTDISTWES